MGSEPEKKANRTRGHGATETFHMEMKESTEQDGEKRVCWRITCHYTTASRFTKTLYLDCLRYVPIRCRKKNKNKKNSAISKPSENLHIAFQRKTKGKIKIYYHLLKILLKINKTSTNKTQQKSPTLSPSLSISAWISLSAAWLADSLRRRLR